MSQSQSRLNGLTGEEYTPAAGSGNNNIIPARKPAHRSWKRKLRHSWLMSKGMLMVMLAQFFGASMNVMTRTLELNGDHGEGMHPFQILFARMGITVLLSIAYMLYTRVPHPLGVPSVRPLLLLRGFSGFFGVFGMYYSLLYLPLSEATVLTFLAPIGCCYICSLTMANETFSRRQQLAALVSLVGVVLIARPAGLFHGVTVGSSTGSGSASSTSSRSSSSMATTTTSSGLMTTNSPTSAGNTPYHRTIGTLAALLGVLGATGAYTSIRIIGKRAHPLVSVTYFSATTTLVSLLGVLAIPSISFRFPENVVEWALLAGLGTCGFVLQFLLTAGLAYVPPAEVVEEEEKNKGLGMGRGERGDKVGADGMVSGTGAGVGAGDDDVENDGRQKESERPKPSTHGSKATSMVYTQMLFALLYDKVVWDATPSALSWVGSGIILASAIYVAVVKESGSKSASTDVGDANKNGNGNGIGGTQPGYVHKQGVEDARVNGAGEGRGLLADHDGREYGGVRQ
ncbi:hypothetical protein AJ79_02190 [Helicocarpus griseus UAMH5409]|uniref:EamA domain-containing protein n=1 Tax=Helicocarpus griseus UAMH5409 TaxID=1447875 RepID=A0A2B7Y3T4_9EURO|nr:hypothetical protein AJ79_02190 [Helicocarpus griseus UAMH5409]